MILFNGENTEEIISLLVGSKMPEATILSVTESPQCGELEITYQLNTGWGKPHIDTLWLNRRDTLEWRGSGQGHSILWHKRASR